MITNKIIEAITKAEEQRQWADPVRLSNAGKCARAIAYQRLGFEMRPLTAKTRMKFKFGDMVERMVKEYLRTCIPTEFKELHIPEEQEELVFDCGEFQVKGHIDGRFKRHDDSMWIFECKSMGSYPFTKALRGNIGYGYECQINAYMHAAGIENALVYCLNKNDGATCEVAFKYKPELIPEIKQRFIAAVNATKDDLPPREYGPNSRGVLPFQCGYCSSIQHCWPSHTKEFEDDKPVFIVAEYHNKEE